MKKFIQSLPAPAKIYFYLSLIGIIVGLLAVLIIGGLEMVASPAGGLAIIAIGLVLLVIAVLMSLLFAWFIKLAYQSSPTAGWVLFVVFLILPVFGGSRFALV